MRKRVVYILSFVEKSLPFEWVIENLDRSVYELSFIILGRDDTPFTRFLITHAIPYSVVGYTDKRDLLPAMYRMFRSLRRARPDAVHVHLFYAGITGIPAAWLAGVRQRIYTRHYSSYHHDYFKKAVYWDRLINFFSTRIVAISQVVRSVLVDREGVAPKKVIYIPHGFDFRYFLRDAAEVESIRVKHGIPPAQYPVVGVISRYTHLKGIQYIIDAFASLRVRYPNAHLVLGNAQGDYKDVLSEQLVRQLPAGAYTEILFEENVRALYGLFDVFVHVPIAADCEAFGQTYVEALAMNVPAVFTLSGIAHEFVQDGVNARVVPYHDATAIREGIISFLEDESFRTAVVFQGYEDVISRFDMRQMMQRLYALYQSV